MHENNDINVLNARKIYYLMFSKFFAFTYDITRFDDAKEMLKLINSQPLDELSQISCQNLLANFNSQEISNEYDDIFHAPPKPMHNTFSYYDEGYSAGRMVVMIKKLIHNTDIRRDESAFKENEDNIGFVFALMADFIDRQINNKQEYESITKELFTQIINPYIDEFNDMLYSHVNAKIYKDISNILATFIEFERLNYNLSRPVYEKQAKAYDGISRSEALRREINRAKRKAEKEMLS